ncbi:MAG: AAA family ATPase [Candidatus Thermoplasmatota archaeon]|nr:AAA family ATPase [Candidatus Thermoplasmatota archaeon]
MSRIVAVVGMPGSGKGVLARVAADAGIIVFSMGDIVREALLQSQLDETPENVASTALSIREKHGEAIVAHRMLPRIQAIEGDDLILIEGVRQSIEMDVFREAFGDDFTILAIQADARVRSHRIAGRGRGEDGTSDDILKRDMRETDWGLPELIKSADETLVNDVNLDTFESRCRCWLGQT